MPDRPPFPPLPDGELRPVYDAECPRCATALGVRPGLSMLHGINSGHGNCPRCGLFLHLQIEPDHARIDAVPWSDYEAAGFVHLPRARRLLVAGEVGDVVDRHRDAFDEMRRRGD